MNFVIIMTDTQPTFLLGTYGNAAVDTPNIDRLAHGGIRFDRAYTACPLCTPARGALFSGLAPEINGAWTNNNAPHQQHALMGTIFRHYGYRAGYTGKWHLDGSAYPGDGQPGGGFEADWWYDGKRHRQALNAGLPADRFWGEEVASRAVDFLRTIGDDSFVLVASFDEPHGPFRAPEHYYESYRPDMMPQRGNYNATCAGKPELLQIQHEENGEVPFGEFAEAGRTRKFVGCSNYIDREIGRVIDAVDQYHADDTMIIYTSDHGDQMRSHGLMEKGPMMYEETCNIPFVVRCPGGPRGGVSRALLSHLDVIPTMLDFAGIEQPEMLEGHSMRQVVEAGGSVIDSTAAPAELDPPTTEELSVIRPDATVSFHRFAINNDAWGEFYPIRCITDGRHKLIINLFETDELYDLEADTWELENRISDSSYREIRDDLHDRMLDQMDSRRDPFRTFRWGARDWRSVRSPYYLKGTRGKARPKPDGFRFQPTSL